MITHAAFATLQFCASVAAFALLARVLTRPGSELRRTAVGVAVMFAVFAVCAAYVWLALGPEIDHRLEVRDQPLLVNPPPAEMEA